jgi:two-component system response regulator YesN
MKRGVRFVQNKKNWFYQTLFSYLPIFFLIVSVLFLIFFQVFSEHIKKTTIKANEVFSEQIAQALDSYLVPIDQLIMKEFLMDELLRNFFSGQNSAPYTIYEISQKINNLIMSFPIIDSVYIVQKTEDLVISNTLFTSSQQFADREFITSQFEVASPTYWSGKRVYKDQKKYLSSNVVSFARKVSLSSPNEGLIVLNIHAEALRKLVVNMSSLETNFVNLYDINGLLILNTDESLSKESKPAPTELVKIKSNYTGWEIRSGIKNEKMFNFFASFPYFWVSLGFISILLGIVLIIFVTRKHYRPIESIINRINEMIISPRNNELFGKGQRDEMRFIEMAIDDLFKNANKYQTQYEQNIVNIRRNLFNELLEGVRVLNREQFESELEKLGMQAYFYEIAICILDIDKYNDFCLQYSNKDQYLLKFVIHSVLGEISQSFGQHVWSE